MKPVKLYWTLVEEGVYHCWIRRNGQFYAFLSMEKCRPDAQTKGMPTRYFFEPLIPGGAHDYDCNPVSGLNEAKAKGKKIVEAILADLNGVTLL